MLTNKKLSNKLVSNKEVTYTYRLGSSANVTRIREALVSKEIVEVHNKEYVFLDPVYMFWLKKFYFRV